MKCIKEIPTKIAGITFYNDGLMGDYRQSILYEMKDTGRLCIGQRLYLLPQPENEFDNNAVAVLAPDGRQIGFVPRTSSKDVVEYLNAGNKYDAQICNISGGTAGIGYHINLNIRFFDKIEENRVPKETGINKVSISQINVKGLFGIFNYTLSMFDDITLIHAMNGGGKTTILRLIYWIFEGQLEKAKDIPCAEFALIMTNGVEIILQSKEGEQCLSEISFILPTGFSMSTNVNYQSGSKLELTNSITNTLINICTGGLRVKFVTANRLYDLAMEEKTGHERVLLCAKDIEKHVENAKDLFAQLGETLDSSFLYRVMENITYQKPVFTYEECNNRRKKLEEQRKNYSSYGLQNAYEGHTRTYNYDVNDKTSNDVLHMLTIYLRDSETKNKMLDGIYNKICLFKQIINQEHEFYYKTLDIDFSKEKAISFKGADDREIKLESLSSGEKHDFILFSELIFGCGSNTLVLIDEPEISLHPAWQMLIVDELMRIGQLNGFQTIVATHSPTIINDHWDRAIALEE